MKWTVPQATQWAVEGSGENQVMKIVTPHPLTEPRRPSQYALAETAPLAEVSIDAEVKRHGKSLLFVYAWRDATHFNYVHISVDTGSKQPVHNGVFHVYGGERVRISSPDGPGALPTEDWTPVRLVYSAQTGLVEVTAGGRKLPALRGVDLSLGVGRVGFGSMNETGQIRKVRIQGR